MLEVGSLVDGKYRILRVVGKGGMSVVYQAVNEKATKAIPAVLIVSDDEEKSKKRVELCPDEWADDFGEDFYDHIIENEFYYLALTTEWQTYASCVPAPGIEQYAGSSEEELQRDMEKLMNRS